MTRRAGTPGRHHRRPIVDGNIGLQSIAEAAEYLAAQIGGQPKGRGVYVFIDPARRNYYALHEERAVAHEWIMERPSWFVGCYAEADEKRLVEDLTEHLGGLE